MLDESRMSRWRHVGKNLPHPVWTLIFLFLFFFFLRERERGRKMWRVEGGAGARAASHEPEVVIVS